MVFIYRGWGFRWKFCVLAIYVICIIMINMKNILHYLYFASFKLFNRIISMYLLCANIHNKKTYVCESIDANTCTGSYQPRLFFGCVCQCVAILMYIFFLYVHSFQLIYYFQSPLKFNFYFKWGTSYSLFFFLPPSNLSWC